MHFYALRVRCPNCGNQFLIGGSTLGDLTLWRRLTVECSRCSSATSAARGEPIDLQDGRMKPYEAREAKTALPV
jgi:predicted Zn finger-like uncharacterized protein